MEYSFEQWVNTQVHGHPLVGSVVVEFSNWGVALFGVGTIIFGISTNTEVSIAALALMGAADMVSVYVRESLIALWTPDQLRGRVNAVNMVFVGASNELGEFRAGTMAAIFGAVPAVVIGGIGTLVVAAIWASSFPKLRRIDTLDAPTP